MRQGPLIDIVEHAEKVMAKSGYGSAGEKIALLPELVETIKSLRLELTLARAAGKPPTAGEEPFDWAGSAWNGT